MRPLRFARTSTSHFVVSLCQCLSFTVSWQYFSVNVCLSVCHIDALFLPFLLLPLSSLCPPFVLPLSSLCPPCVPPVFLLCSSCVPPVFLLWPPCSSLFLFFCFPVCGLLLSSFTFLLPFCFFLLLVSAACVCVFLLFARFHIFLSFTDCLQSLPRSWSWLLSASFFVAPRASPSFLSSAPPSRAGISMWCES